MSVAVIIPLVSSIAANNADPISDAIAKATKPQISPATKALKKFIEICFKLRRKFKRHFISTGTKKCGRGEVARETIPFFSTELYLVSLRRISTIIRKLTNKLQRIQ